MSILLFLGYGLATVAAMWLMVSAVAFLIGRFGSWHQLKRRYLALCPPVGMRKRMCSGIIGHVPYQRCLNVWIAPEGLFLGVSRCLRLGHPLLLIPWSELHPSPIQTAQSGREVTLIIGQPRLGAIQLPAALFQPSPQAVAAP